MNVTYIITSVELEKLKQKARKLKKSAGIPHHEALEQVAKAMGLPSWHQVAESAQVTSQTEKAYFTGFIVATDFKDAETFNIEDAFVEDHQALEFCQRDLEEAYRRGCEEEGEPATEEDVREFLQDSDMNYVFFRFVGKDVPLTVEDAVKLVREHSFWPPQLMWLRGEFVDTYYEDALNADGELVGVRF